MKFKNFYILSLVLIILFLPALLGFLIRSLPEYSQPLSHQTFKLNRVNQLSQTFKSSKNDLSEIGLTFKNPSLINKKDVMLEIRENGTLLRRIIKNGNVIDDGGFVKFKFSPVLNSKDKVMEFSLSSENSLESESLEVYATKIPQNNYLELLINGQRADSSLAFVPFYTQGRLQTVVSIYDNLFNRLSKDVYFFVFYILIFIVLIGYLKYLKK